MFLKVTVLRAWEDHTWDTTEILIDPENYDEDEYGVLFVTSDPWENEGGDTAAEFVCQTYFENNMAQIKEGTDTGLDIAYVYSVAWVEEDEEASICDFCGLPMFAAEGEPECICPHCPQCGTFNMPSGDAVICQTCGTKYDPQTGSPLQ